MNRLKTILLAGTIVPALALTAFSGAFAQAPENQKHQPGQRPEAGGPHAEPNAGGGKRGEAGRRGDAGARGAGSAERTAAPKADKAPAAMDRKTREDRKSAETDTTPPAAGKQNAKRSAEKNGRASPGDGSAEKNGRASPGDGSNDARQNGGENDGMRTKGVRTGADDERTQKKGKRSRSEDNGMRGDDQGDRTQKNGMRNDDQGDRTRKSGMRNDDQGDRTRKSGMRGESPDDRTQKNGMRGDDQGDRTQKNGMRKEDQNDRMQKNGMPNEDQDNRMRKNGMRKEDQDDRMRKNGMRKEDQNDRVQKNGMRNEDQDNRTQKNGMRGEGRGEGMRKNGMRDDGGPGDRLDTQRRLDNGQNRDLRNDRGDRGGIGAGGAAAIGAAAGFAGGFLAATNARHLDEIRRDRRQTVEDGRTYIREPGRTIVEDGGRAYIVHDENDRFRQLGYNVRRERRGNDFIDIVDRPGGEQILTFTTADGRMLRRVRRTREGREVVLIDNGTNGRVRPIQEDVVDLPPPLIRIPRDRYVVDYHDADEGLIYDTLVAPPVAPPPKRYTLDQIRYSPDVRSYVRSVDINTINFESGSWTVPGEATGKLRALAGAINKAVARNPNSVFMVEGFTDATGNPTDNLSLSDRRAQSVAAILTKDFNVPPENLTTQGYGQQNPKESTQGPSAANRRVVVQNITPLLAAGGEQPE